MFDTVILQLKASQFVIKDGCLIGKEVYAGNYSYCNHSFSNKVDIYMPRVKVIQRGNIESLRIEFSAPKLLFGNNLEELSMDDSEAVFNTLIKRLNDLGIIVLYNDLVNAEVVAFHPSKNISLNNGYTSSFAIRELSKISISKRFDIDIKDYRNGGQCLQFYTKLFSITIYDKMGDLLKPVSRAVDKDQIKGQRDLFDNLRSINNFTEILRIEIRIIGKRKIGDFLLSIGFNQQLKFRDLFDEDFLKKIIYHVWNNIFDDNRFLFTLNDSAQEELELIIMKDPKISIVQAIKLVGLMMLVRDKDGVLGLRKKIEGLSLRKEKWGVVRRNLRHLEWVVEGRSMYGFINEIEKSLEAFKPYRII